MGRAVRGHSCLAFVDLKESKLCDLAYGCFVRAQAPREGGSSGFSSLQPFQTHPGVFLCHCSGWPCPGREDLQRSRPTPVLLGFCGVVPVAGDWGCTRSAPQPLGRSRRSRTWENTGDFWGWEGDPASLRIAEASGPREERAGAELGI